MKITQAENSSGSKFAASGVSIKFMVRSGFIPVGSFVNVTHDGKEHHFSVTHCITSPIEDVPGAASTSHLIVTASETGYHGRKFKPEFDPRLLLEQEVIPVTDPVEIAQIRKESSYC